MGEIERASTSPGGSDAAADGRGVDGVGAVRPAPLTAAEAEFLERCRDDLAGLFGRNDAVESIELGIDDDDGVLLQAHVVVSGTPTAFTARGETIVEAYGRLRAAAPEQRVAAAFRAVVAEPVRR